ncbi:M48 family metallopeptidase [Gilvimarinus algae]|uniref:SprT family zinc-dependent metalloprotease n=1 Tax=Gilvimarinus algae TaxID=3058037 RepID=A0ABT8TAB0_9GAMM|nr:SprT family zinc-dependent metalloprotease [Gilvimarinus sp. SDUM040014]MDO3381047.1 SprT family zinc-dependent metalloprotease [Gilvimarinus sp. SDUM040014]
MASWHPEFRFSAKRRTIGIEVRETRVIVRAPKGFSQAQLQRLVREKASWIDAKVRQQQLRIQSRPRYEYRGGERFPFLGDTLVLAVSLGASAACQRVGQTLQIQLSCRSRKPQPEQVLAGLTGWYRAQALELLENKTYALCRQLGRHCRTVRVRATRSKWGHCTAQGDIQYNWQIVLAPESVVDYLVAHEVSHLVHRHHGPAFWDQVEKLCPGYRHNRQWLREHGHLLILPPL